MIPHLFWTDDIDLVEKINSLDINDQLKRSLLHSVEQINSPVEFSLFLLDTIERLDSILQDQTERLIYAELNRTHPKDILVVGDGKIELNDMDVKISDDKFTAGFNFKF